MLPALEDAAPHMAHTTNTPAAKEIKFTAPACVPTSLPAFLPAKECTLCSNIHACGLPTPPVTTHNKDSNNPSCLAAPANLPCNDKTNPAPG